ncbi:MAG: 4Fe-4S binding protein [Deltaproteobacteria bacterium]|nr:4Fe-4S binding protein [Deltaproteobacteria bacterium]MCL5276350.1 4Fe-4S binding protein [Deltaproteobacteria bacterium]
MRTTELIKLVNKVVPERDFIFLDAEKCDNCHACIFVCPSCLWEMKAGKVAIKKDYKALCLECGACYQACLPDAIRFDFPPAGSGIAVKYG